MDTLDTLLSFTQLSGSINLQCHFQKEWYVAHHAGDMGQGIVHIVTRGSSYLKLDEREKPRVITQGDVVFFPRSAYHILSNHITCDNKNAPLFSSKKGAFTLKHSGFDDPDFSLFCAKFHYDKHSDLFTNLPDIIILNVTDLALDPIITLLQQESAIPQHGAVSMVNSLSKVLLILLVRTYLAQENATLSGMLRGFRDKRLHKVMDKVIQHPEHPWRIHELSDIANLSRAQLIRLFNQQIGLSPHAFVNHIRLQKATKLLHTSQESILTIAFTCGFQSETNFGKAFKKYFGITASEYRKNGKTHELEEE